MRLAEMPTDTAAPEADLRKRQTFGRKLRAARNRARLTQHELGAKAGVGFQQVSHAECGRTWPSLPVYLRMCRALGFEEIPLGGR